MKKKKSIYILLPVVLLIWAMVIYQFFSFSNPDVPNTVASTNYAIKPIAIPERDTFAIDVNYRDPFLGKMYLPNKATKNTKRQKPKVTTPIVFPRVVYKGIVSDNKNEVKVFMVIINGQTFLMKENDTELDVTLKTGNREYVEVIYKKQKNKIPIQQ